MAHMFQCHILYNILVFKYNVLYTKYVRKTKSVAHHIFVDVFAQNANNKILISGFLENANLCKSSRNRIEIK